MNAERQRRVEAAFLAALELGEGSPAERHRVVAERCENDPAAIAEVLSLLGAHAAADAGVLDRRSVFIPRSLGVSPTVGGSEGADSWSMSPGTRLGDFTITRVIGAGGMGVVYEAEQERPRRVVALKVIQGTRLSTALTRRFEHEAEILGRLQHPGIAQIFGAGVGEIVPPGGVHGAPGRRVPFLAMELVDGRAITDFAENKELDTEARLRLIAQVCDAVNHAHQRGVIHRDLKPSNILVEETGESTGGGGTGSSSRVVGQQEPFRARVLDFGVARVTDSDRCFTTMQTSVGQLIGTLPYMSPEQVAGDPAEVDTRSDVYALGVVMYQLLTGKLPHDVSSASIPEAARIIRDEEPSRLSSISRVFRGDIDTIVSKALEKDKSRRYQSAAALAEDIRNFLSGNPIQARRDSIGYVLNKKLSRYRTILRVILGFVALVVGLLVYVSILASRENAARVQKSLLADQNAALATERGHLAGELDRQLSIARIESARLMVQLNKFALAEDQIWDEWVRRPDLVPAKWALWELYARSPCARSLPQLAQNSTAGAFGPRGEFLVICGRRPGVLELWDGGLGRQLGSAVMESQRGAACAVCPDGSHAVIADSTGQVSLWDLPGLTMRKSLQISDSWIGRPVFSPDGALLALSGRDPVVRIYRAGTMELLHEMRGHTKFVFSMAFSPDGERLVTGAADETIRIWNPRSGALVDSLDSKKGGHAQEVTAVAVSPDGRSFATASLRRELKLWDMTTLACRKTMSNILGFPHNLSYSPDGRTLYVGADSIEVCDAETGQSRRTLAAIGSGSMQMNLSPDGSLLLACQSDGVVRLLETGTDMASQRLGSTHGVSGDVRFVRGSRMLVGPAPKGAVRIWADARAPAPTHTDAPGHARPISSLACSPNGAYLASCSMDGHVLVRRLPMLEKVSECRLDNEAGAGIYLSPDGRQMALSRVDQKIELRSFPDLQPVATLLVKDLMGAIRVNFGELDWSPDSRRLVAVGNLRVAMIWEPPDVYPKQTLDSVGGQGAVAHLPGNRLAIGGSEGICIFDLASGAEVQRLRGHAGNVTALRAGPEGLLASAGRDRTVRLWDLTTGTCVLTLDTGDQAPGAMDVSEDGWSLVCSLENGEVVVWDLSYYDRHIAANMAQQVARVKPSDPAELERRLKQQLRLPRVSERDERGLSDDPTWVPGAARDPD